MRSFFSVILLFSVSSCLRAELISTVGGTAYSQNGTIASCRQSGFSAASCSDGYYGGVWGPIGRLSGSSSAAFGAVSARADAGSYRAWAQFVSEASFTDTLTILGGSGTAFLQYTLSDHQVWGSESGGQDPSLTLWHDGLHWELPFSGNFDVARSFQFTFGVPFDFGLSVWTYASASGHESAFAEASSSIRNLAVYLGTCEATGCSGAPATGLRYSAASGAHYAFTGAVHSPEPGTLSLLGIALGTIFVVRRGRGQKLRFRQS